MDIETTTCISLQHLAILQSYTAKYNIPIRTFISLMIRFAAKNDKRKVETLKRISYRPRNRNDGWKRLHLTLYYSEYEFFLDVKKVWKMSLAKIIAFCVDNVLDEFLIVYEKRLRENTDNYKEYYESRTYTFAFYKVKGIHCCKFYWGPPPQLFT